MPDEAAPPSPRPRHGARGGRRRRPREEARGGAVAAAAIRVARCPLAFGRRAPCDSRPSESPPAEPLRGLRGGAAAPAAATLQGVAAVAPRRQAGARGSGRGALTRSGSAGRCAAGGHRGGGEALLCAATNGARRDSEEALLGVSAQPSRLGTPCRVGWRDMRAPPWGTRTGPVEDAAGQGGGGSKPQFARVSSPLLHNNIRGPKWNPSCSCKTP